MPRLFVDLDGVLADFDRGAELALGMPCHTFQELHGAAVMWKALEATPDFYARLEWTADGRELWNALADSTLWDGPPPMILSGLPLGTWADPQKREWCNRELGVGVPVITCMSIDKPHYCVAGDILIDDRETNGRDWTAAGGQFILHRSAAESVAALRSLMNPQPQPMEGTS